MRLLIVKIFLVVLPLFGYGEEGSLFTKIFKNKVIGKSLAHTFLTNESYIILYDHNFGLEGTEYQIILLSEESGKDVQLVHVSKSNHVRFDSLKNYNEVIWDYLVDHIVANTRTIKNKFSFSKCQKYTKDIFQFNQVIEFSKDSIVLTAYSKCMIEEFYLPILNHQADGDWELSIKVEPLFLSRYSKESVRIYFERVNYLDNYLNSWGVPSSKINRDMEHPKCLTGYQPKDNLIEVKIKMVKKSS